MFWKVGAREEEFGPARKALGASRKPGTRRFEAMVPPKSTHGGSP